MQVFHLKQKFKEIELKPEKSINLLTLLLIHIIFYIFFNFYNDSLLFCIIESNRILIKNKWFANFIFDYQYFFLSLSRWLLLLQLCCSWSWVMGILLSWKLAMLFASCSGMSYLRPSNTIPVLLKTL